MSEEKVSRRFNPPCVTDILKHGWTPYSDIHRERIRAHRKHDSNGGSMERKSFVYHGWLPVLTEELGEVARVLCDHELGVLPGVLPEMLREELVQLAARTVAWIDAIDSAELDSMRGDES